MRLRIFLAFSSLSLLLITGCWNRTELDDFSFAQAVAIDMDDKQAISLTTHFYKPNGSGGESSGKAETKGSAFNIQTAGENVFDAIRDITLHLGRKAKWDHMRIILVGEDIAKQENIEELLDFFIRDHEPRPTAYIAITKGKASEYLKLKPYIEQTMGQQLRLTDEIGYQSTGKSVKSTLMDLGIQFKSSTGVSRVAYLSMDKAHLNQPLIAGVAVLKNGKLAVVIPSSEVKGLLLLTNLLRGGIYNMDCEKGNKIKNEAFELTFVNSKIKPIIKKNGDITVQVKSTFKGSDGELQCSSIKTVKEEEKFEQRVGDEAIKEMKAVIKHLQTEKIDALGIGNKIFASKPQLWKQWSENWGEHFADIQFTFQVKVEIINIGTQLGEPSGK